MTIINLYKIILLQVGYEFQLSQLIKFLVNKLKFYRIDGTYTIFERKRNTLSKISKKNYGLIHSKKQKINYGFVWI